jgi:hypothetical protein
MDLQNFFVPPNAVMQPNIIENVILENPPINNNTNITMENPEEEEEEEDVFGLDDISIDDNTATEIHENTETPENQQNKIVPSKKAKPTIDIIFTYKEYCNKKWEKYKLPEIKQIVKKLKLKVTGRKNVLIARINGHFGNYEKANKIQKVFRGYIVRYSYLLRGPAYNKRHICVNETDGFSLEPIAEIMNELFFSFKDKHERIYGFDIQSLITAYNNKPRILNPYTREDLSNEVVKDMISLGNIVSIVYPELGVSKIVKRNEPRNRIYDRRRELNRIGNRPPQNTTAIENTVLPANTINNEANSVANSVANNELFLTECLAKLLRIRQNPYNTRVEELFMEIDLLGNYTQSSWFNNLDNNECYRFLRILQDLWRYRDGITAESRRKICIFDPFSGVRVNLENIREKCIRVMENFVYTGIDVEYRKLGVYYILSCLTMVSMNARMNLYWLYEAML